MPNRFRPNTTVAVIIRYQDEFLLVEEREFNRAVFNQAAGHIEANESIEAAAIREALEETGLNIKPDYISGIYYFFNETLNVHYLRFCFVADLTNQLSERPLSKPQDSAIIASHWFTKTMLYSKENQMRSPLVLKCFDDYFNGQKIPLETLKSNL